jgi:hypothetical protein
MAQSSRPSLAAMHDWIASNHADAMMRPEWLQKQNDRKWIEGLISSLSGNPEPEPESEPELEASGKGKRKSASKSASVSVVGTR